MENLAKVESSQDVLDDLKEMLWEGRFNKLLRY